MSETKPVLLENQRLRRLSDSANRTSCSQRSVYVARREYSTLATVLEVVVLGRRQHLRVPTSILLYYSIRPLLRAEYSRLTLYHLALVLQPTSRSRYPAASAHRPSRQCPSIDLSSNRLLRALLSFAALAVRTRLLHRHQASLH